MNIADKLKSLGYKTVDMDFYRKVEEWKSWYIGDVKDFHRYTVYNGSSNVKCKRYSLQMGKKIPEDWANLLMNEKVSITLEGQKEQEFVDRIFEENNFLVKSNELQEKAFALGTVAFVPRVTGMKRDSQTPEAGTVPGSAEGNRDRLRHRRKHFPACMAKRCHSRMRVCVRNNRERRGLLLFANP